MTAPTLSLDELYRPGAMNARDTSDRLVGELALLHIYGCAVVEAMLIGAGEWPSWVRYAMEWRAEARDRQATRRELREMALGGAR